MAVSAERLKQLLLKKGVLDRLELNMVEAKAREVDEEFMRVLIKEGYISSKGLGELIAEDYGVKYVDLREISINPQILNIVPKSFASAKKVIPFSLENKSLSVAMQDPSDKEALSFIESRTDCSIIPYYTDELSVQHALKLYNDGKEELRELQEKVKNIEQEVERSNLTVTELAKKDSVVKLFEGLVDYAVKSEITALHFEIAEGRGIIRARRENLMKDLISVSKELYKVLITRIKILGGLKVAEQRLPQEGRFYLRIGDKKLSVKASIMPVSYGERAVLRLIDLSAVEFSLEDLGLEGENLERVRGALSERNGLMFVCGPSKSGKTTTLYTLLNLLNSTELNTFTIEDSIEYNIPRVNQILLKPSIGLTEQVALRTVIRQDVDVVMLGGKKNNEVLSLAFDAAMGGVFVLSSATLADSVKLLEYLLGIGIERYQIASEIGIIVAQRLVRRVCPDCREEVSMDGGLSRSMKERLMSAGVPEHEVGKYESFKTFKGQGCANCSNTGYKGKVGIFEVLSGSLVKEEVLVNFEIKTVRQRLFQEGFRPLIIDGLKKVNEGVTTVEEIVRAVS